jgi:DNA-binding NarL/FixJ family response regulator
MILLMICNSPSQTTGKTALKDLRTKVLLVEDHLVIREGLIKVLEGTDDVIVSDTAATAEEGLMKVHDDLDLVILDISLPGRDGIWLAGEIKAKHPSLPILILTMHEQASFVLRALKAGVDGYLTKWAGQTELLKAVRTTARNGSYLQTRVAPLVVNALRRRGTTPELLFSDREHQIAKCLVNGMSNTEIASQIRLSISTVKSDLRSLYAKLEVSCRTEAVAMVVQKGIVTQG